jgi:hypothetical protein
MGRKVAFLLAVATGLLVAAPHWYGAWKTPPGTLFLWSGFPWDSNQYFAFMRIGYRGEWLLTNLLTSEAHPPVLLMPFYVGLGQLAGVYRDVLTWREGATPEVWRVIPIVYHNARVVLTVALVLVLYWLACRITTRRAQRLWMVVLALFGSGTVWIERISTESSVLSSCILFPNFSAALICYLLVCGGLLAAVRADANRAGRLARTARVKMVLTIAAGAFGLAWIHPFDIPTLGVLAGVLCVWQWRVSGRLPRHGLTACATLCLAAGLPILHQLAVAWRFDDFADILRGNTMPWPSAWRPLVLLEMLLALGIGGCAFLARRRQRPQDRFLLAWVVVGLAMLWVPLPFQRRTIEGLPIALAFALPALIEGGIVRRLLKRGKRSTDARRRIRLLRHIAYAAVLLLLLPRTIAVLYDKSIGVFGRPNDHYYMPLGEAEAMAWLERNSPGDAVVWASAWRGNRVPFLSGRRVVFGHGVMTVDSAKKKQLTNDLFSFRLSPGELRNAIADHGVDYLLWTENDRALDPEGRRLDAYGAETLGPAVFDNGSARIFRVPQ